MARLRPGRTCRDITSQSWSRYSLRRALPHTSLLIFNMGVRKDTYDLDLTLRPQQSLQLRSNALESARQVVNKYMEAHIPLDYMFRVLVYPHNVIREHKMSTAAGADRTSRGMSLSFGKPVAIAARIKEGQPIFQVKTMACNRNVAVSALRRATVKLSGTYKIKVV
jgi:large subunit ribosomal protein L10e